MSLITSVFEVLKNFTLNSLGVERDLMKLIQDKDISKAMELFENNDEAVKLAKMEYDPEQHAVMERKNKRRKNRDPYIVQKLPRAWQRYINEIALFFLLAKPVRFSAEGMEENKERDEAFSAFKGFLKDVRFDANMRQFKRLAGAETECAKLYHLYQDSDGKPAVRVVILSRETGYYLRPLKDQYQKMVAFGYGYYLKEGANTVEHFDIETPKITFKCKKSNLGWDVVPEENKVGKMKIIYSKQPKEWEGSQRRIERDEMIDSKTGDVNEYFADPIAMGTAGALANLMDPEQVGKVIKLASKDDIFKYVEPPTSLEMKESEKTVIRGSILQDSFTPDFNFEAMTGMGTLSGEALRRALILGYIKRDNRKEIYDELMDREISLILAIMKNVTHIGLKGLDKLNITHEFAEPFDEDTSKRMETISTAYSGGVLSLEQAVKMLGLVSDVKAEVDKIKVEQKSKQTASIKKESQDNDIQEPKGVV